MKTKLTLADLDRIGWQIARAEGWGETYEEREARAEAHAEFMAETAWLRHAEMPTLDDMAFEEWERARGCELDPQSGY